MNIIAIANQKGGVGKTTTAITLAHGLALAGCQVLLVDLDPQGQCATFLGQPTAPGVFGLLVQKLPLMQLVHLARPNLWLLPGDHTTSHAGVILSTLNAPINTLKSALTRQWDYILIDTAPSINTLQAQAIYAADFVLIPTACDFASVYGITNLEQTLIQLKNDYHWRGRLLGILPTFYDNSTLETKSVMADLKMLYEGSIFSPIHRATTLREASASGQTILEFHHSCRAALQYAQLVSYIRKFGGNNHATPSPTDNLTP